MSGIRDSSASRKTFQGGQGAQQQRQRVRPGPTVLTDHKMEGELQFCLHQLNCYEDAGGYRLRRAVIKEIEDLLKVWIIEEAGRQGLGRTAQCRLVSYGSFKLSVIDSESDLDLLCVVPSHVTRSNFFSSFYQRLQNKVRIQGLKTEAYKL